MTAYLIATVRVDDPETYKKYTAQTPALVTKYGGKFIVRGGEVEALEGPAFDRRIVVLEFPSKEVVRTFYNSPEYQEVAKIRHAAAESSFLLVDGVPDGVDAPDAQVTKSG
ncbi:MAG: DUF1330 domain-containing protein [Alphaproteobacteria bacterium]